jgi:hypothetical protein
MGRFDVPPKRDEQTTSARTWDRPAVEAEAASDSPDFVAAYKQSRWSGPIPMRIFVGALAYYRKSPDFGSAVRALFSRSAKRPNACEAFREWFALHQEPQT